jgi:high-affinity iron transporter
LIYNRSVRINLGKFFQITGTMLIVVAAGVLSYGIHEYQELGWLPGADSFIWDVTGWMAKDSILATVLAGTIGFDTTTSWLQFLVAGSYIAIILWVYLKPSRAAKKDLISA